MPVDFSQIIEGRKLLKADEWWSVKSHIYLMLMTNLGEYQFDGTYGSKLWDHDFDLSVTETNWTTEVEVTLANTNQRT